MYMYIKLMHTPRLQLENKSILYLTIPQSRIFLNIPLSAAVSPDPVQHLDSGLV